MPTDPRPRLAELTTLGLGGPARSLVVAGTDAELAAACRDEQALVLGGGSNLVVGDAGVDRAVVRIATTGIDVDAAGVASIAAGHDWDAAVAELTAAGWCGLAPLSGIPGSTGATPVQNVGAYGTDVAHRLHSVRLLDRRDGSAADVPAAGLELGYRTSTLRGRSRWVVTRVRLQLSRRPDPVRYAELAGRLGVGVGDVAPEAAVREAVLGLRRGKGMVLDPADPDSRSAGSFFTNPILDGAGYAAFADRVRSGGHPGPVPTWPADGGHKLSAAWLIQRAGFDRGHPGPGGRVGVSAKHTLALVNRGGSTADLIALAAHIRDGVLAAFGVELVPEPVFVGVDWPAPTGPNLGREGRVSLRS